MDERKNEWLYICMSVGDNIFLESDVLSQLPLLKRFRSGCGLRYFE